MVNRWGNNGNSDRLIFLSSKITADDDFSHKIKRHLLLGRKVMTNLDSILKNKRHSGQFSHSVVSNSLWPHELAACQASLLNTISRSSLKLTSIESVMPSSYLILCCSLFLLPPIPPSIRVFSNESTLRMRWPKYWSFSFSIIPSKEHPKVHLVKAMVFPVVMYGCESWTIKAERWRIDAFELWCWRRLLRVPWTASES